LSGKLVIIVIIALLTGECCFAQIHRFSFDSQPFSLNITHHTGSQKQAIFIVNTSWVPSEAFEKANIKHVYYESPGPVHQLLTWRRDSRHSLNKRSCIDSFNKII